MKKLFAAVLILGLAACTKAGTSNESATGAKKAHNSTTQAHVLRIADGSGDIDSLNPHLFQETTLGNIAEMTMAWLARYDHDNKPVPELLTVIPSQANGGISKDGKVITWHLRKDAKWSDGVPFTADDVVFSTGVVLNPKNKEIGRDGWDLITKIDEPDKYTVVYHLRKPYEAFLPTFFGTGGANPCILPKHLLAGLPDINTAPYNSKPVGIGPFKVAQWRRGESVELVADPLYFRGKPKLQRIIYKLIASRDTLATQMQTGDVDLWAMVPAAYIKQMQAIQTLNTPVQASYYYAHLDFNTQRPLVSDVRVREAVRYALDRKGMRDKVGHGFGVLQEGVVSGASPLADTTIPVIDQDVPKAKSLLDEAGWKVGADGIRTKGGKRLSLEFPYYTGSPDSDERVELIRSELKDVGIEIQTRKYSPALFFALPQDGGIMYGGKWDLTTFSWGGSPDGDLSNVYSCDQIPPHGQNDSRYCNAQATQWMAQFKATYNPAEHKRLSALIQRQIVKDVPVIVLYVPQDGWAQNSDLKGFNPNQVSPFDDMMNVDIQ